MAGSGEIKYPWRTKTGTAALQCNTGVSRARGRNLGQKSPDPPDWVLTQ